MRTAPRTMPFGEFAHIQPTVRLEKGLAYSFIEMSDVKPHVKHVKPGGLRTWNGSGGAKFQDGDILFARITPCLEHGKAARVCNLTDSRGFGSTEFFVFRARKDISDPDYIYYLSKSPIIREPAIKSMIGASGRQRAQKIVVESTLVPAPSLPEQGRIAVTLSTYDNLIENNRRRIQLLKQSAWLIYKEWFVHLRFPGHEHVEITDGIPDEWEKKRLGDVAPLNYGKALKDDDRVPGPFPVYGSSGVIGTHVKAMIPGPTIILGRKGNVGSVFWSSIDCHPIDTVYYIDSSKCSFHLYYALQHMSFISTDVAVPGLNRDFAHSRYVLVPERKVYCLFEDTVTPLHRQIDVLRLANVALESVRDLLLPLLMNGEVAV